MKNNTDAVLLLAVLNPYIVLMVIGLTAGLFLYPTEVVASTTHLVSSIWDIVVGAIGFLIDSAAQIIRHY